MPNLNKIWREQFFVKKGASGFSGFAGPSRFQKQILDGTFQNCLAITNIIVVNLRGVGYRHYSARNAAVHITNM
jgi:hypothetical protein